jgi:hypothetical protein
MNSSKNKHKIEGVVGWEWIVKKVYCIELKAMRTSDTSGLVVSEETSVWIPVKPKFRSAGQLFLRFGLRTRKQDRALG